MTNVVEAGRCGRPTRKGTSCRLPLKGGKCPTHDCDLSHRNSEVRAAFEANDPDAYHRHQRRAGASGFAKLTAGNPGKAAEILAEFRRKNPSTPERIVNEWLRGRGINTLRDAALFGLYADIVI
jgi:hypothetical protein